MEENLMNLIISDKADGWDCFDTVKHLQNSFSFDWEAVFSPHQTAPNSLAENVLVFGAHTIRISAPERFRREIAALYGQCCTACPASQSEDEGLQILLGGKEGFRLIDDRTSAAVIDLCGVGSEDVLAEKITRQPEDILALCVAAAERLRNCSALLLTDDGLWGRTLTMMIYAAAKEAGFSAEIAILQPQAVSYEEMAKRRCQIVTDWVLRRLVHS